MKIAEIKFKIQLAKSEVTLWENILRNKKCADCQNWQRKTEGCDLAGGQEPPPEIQKTGCDSFDWDEIPF